MCSEELMQEMVTTAKLWEQNDYKRLTETPARKTKPKKRRNRKRKSPPHTYSPFLDSFDYSPLPLSPPSAPPSPPHLQLSHANIKSLNETIMTMKATTSEQHKEHLQTSDRRFRVLEKLVTKVNVSLKELKPGRTKDANIESSLMQLKQLEQSGLVIGARTIQQDGKEREIRQEKLLRDLIVGSQQTMLEVTRRHNCVSVAPLEQADKFVSIKSLQKLHELELDNTQIMDMIAKGMVTQPVASEPRISLTDLKRYFDMKFTLEEVIKLCNTGILNLHYQKNI